MRLGQECRTIPHDKDVLNDVEMKDSFQWQHGSSISMHARVPGEANSGFFGGSWEAVLSSNTFIK